MNPFNAAPHCRAVQSRTYLNDAYEVIALHMRGWKPSASPQLWSVVTSQYDLGGMKTVLSERSIYTIQCLIRSMNKDRGRPSRMPFDCCSTSILPIGFEGKRRYAS